MTTLPSRVQYAVYDSTTGIIQRAGSAGLLDALKQGEHDIGLEVKICPLDCLIEFSVTDGHTDINTLNNVPWILFA